MEFSKTALAKWLDEALEMIYRHSKQLFYGVIAAGVLGIVYLGYGYYDQSMQAGAHKAFMEALKCYDAAVVAGSQSVTTGDTYQFGSDAEKWKTVETTFAASVEQYKSTRLGSVMRAYHADALAHLGNYDAALAQLKSAVKAMPSSEVQDFYKVKLALLKTDSTNSAVVQEGIAELKEMASNAYSTAHEVALYYTGLYFWTHKDYGAASNYWQQLMVKYGLKDTKAQSGYADLVRSKLKLISAEW